MPNSHRLPVGSGQTELKRIRVSLLATIAFIAPLGAACSSDGGDPVTASPAAPSLRTIDPAALQSVLETRARELLVPGAVAVVRTPSGDFTGRYGATTYRGTTPPAVSDHIRVGSVTKTFTGTVILQQAQEGLLSLDDPVSKYRPEVPNGERITIAQLLEMRSGLFNYSTTVELNQALDDAPQRVWRRDELLSIAFARPPYFAPGQGFTYSNTNTVLLGLIAEQVERGKPLAAIMRDRLFVPLGMRNTLLPADDANGLPAPYARGYMYGTNVETMDPAGLPADRLAAARAGTFQPGDRTFDNPSWGWAAGAGISTAEDLVIWAQALAGGRVLGPALQARRLASVRPISADAPAGSAQYGLAIAKFGPLYGHTGELPGYNTFVGHDPARNVTVVVWANLDPSPAGGATATAIARELIDRIYAAP